MAFSLGSLSAPAQDFFSQFQPYEQGGITGQPTVDPGQLQPNAPMPTKPGAPVFQPGPSSADLAAQHPDWPKTPWGMPYDPNVGYNGGVIYHGDMGNGPVLGSAVSLAEPPIDPSRYDPSKTFEDYYRDYHSPDRDAVLRDYPGMAKHHLMGGSVGRLGSLSSTLPSQGQQGVLNALMHRVMAPDGRMVQVPDHQLADVLQRGGRKVGGF